ncbi:FAD-dependent oxidoreductase [Aureibacillus halotolerans]|uniref:FAD dependent oxidoreductase n=1 Tax=Aureibacillus halotolerans TaxID=1508390 RepID=A0A4R6TYS9_9BACI|nr:FAD-dependent oxidoreductase [Aureibacillus halotolerans]TDQ37199.1 FAD dependent oxidoreductase [Aureibacillus halotolerans]
MKTIWLTVGAFILSIALTGCSFNQDEGDYDVVVYGGEPEGVAAAVAAARSGANTLLIAERDGLGGLMTYGMLNYLDVAHDKDGNPANTGIFKEWHKMVGNKPSFDVVEGKEAFHTLVENEENITLMTEAQVKSVEKEGKKLTGITVAHDGEDVTIQGRTFIDSTQDADLAVLADVPYTLGREDTGLMDTKMAVTLMIHVDNVDWEGIKRAVEEETFGPAQILKNAAWGFSELHTAYTPVEENTRLRGLNIALQNDGSVYINALQIFGVDGLNEEDKQAAIEKGIRETDAIVAYLQENFPGFEDAEVASYPDELYVRETRHIQAEYQLNIMDVCENNDQWDSIGFGGYPVDVQATSVNDWGIVVCNPVQYAVPFRSLVPLEVDGLLVASRSSGYTSLAAGSARVIPIGMTAGQAAGIAATRMEDSERTLREVANDESWVATLQAMLVEQGVNLYPFDLPHMYEGEWFYEGIQTVMRYGMIKGGYQNDIGADDPMTSGEFHGTLKELLRRTNPENPPVYPNVTATDGNVTRNEAASVVLALNGLNESGTPWETARTEGLISEVLFSKVTENRELAKKEVYALMGEVIRRAEERQSHSDTEG